MKSRLALAFIVAPAIMLIIALTAVARVDQLPALHQPAATDYVEGEVLLKLRPGATLSSAPGSPIHSNSAALVEHLRQITARAATAVFAGAQSEDLRRIYRVQFDPDQDVGAVINLLEADPAIEYAEPNYLARAAIIPNDPLYSSQWAWAKINAPAAWNVVTGTPGVVIAIVDSGIDTTHSDLAGRLWINPGEIAANGIDDDNNGHLDDVNGWNFVGSNNNIADDNGHGTQVAGAAGASANNAIGIAGMCWNCRLMIVKAMQASGVANYSDIAAAVNYAASKGAQVINLSLGGYADSVTLRAAIEAASSTSVIVGGAGNDNVSTPFYPAAYSNVLAVASTTFTDTKASFSDYGSWVDVAAPGVAISTTFSGGDYGTSEGTSLSAPLVAGLAGLLKSVHPDWSPALVRAQIIHTTDVITDIQLGSGRINAASAMQAPRPLFSIDGYTVNGTANGRLDPNSGNALIVSVSNDWLDATNVVGTLSESDPFVTVVTGAASFGNIASGVMQGSAPYSFTVASGAGYNHPIAFTLNLSANGGAYTATLPLSITTASAVINVQGTIASNTVWANDRIYLVTNNIGVAPGVTLTIQPGTVIKFYGNYTLNVAGTLIADGTTAQPIRFTREATASWGQIKFLYSSTAATFDGAGNYTGGSIIRHAIIEHGQSINLELAAPFIAQNAFQNMSSNAITGYPPYGGLVISDNTFTSSGIELYGTDQTGNAILRNQITGGAIRMTTKAAISGNSITNCNGQGISAIGGTVSSNRVVGCAEGIFMSGNDGSVSGNLVSNNSQYGIHVYSPVTVTNNTVTNNNLAGLYVEGTPTPAVVYSNNLIASAGGYAVRLATGYGINNNVNAAGNYWGTTNDAGIQQAIYDGMDEFGLGSVNYSGFLSDAVQTAPAYVRKVTALPDTTLGIQTGTFEAEFSRPMDMNRAPDMMFYPTQRDTWQVYRPASWGLQSNAIWATAIAQDGIKWVGTSAGLARFNGSTWLTYTVSNSGLPSDYIQSIAVDDSGIKWIGTDRGVARFDDSGWTVYNSSNSGLPTNHAVAAIAIDGAGVRWFGLISSAGIGGGVASFDGMHWTVYNTANSGLPSNDVYVVAIDHDGRKWFGTASGAARFDGTSWTVYDTSNSPLSSNEVRAIAIDRNGTKWLATGAVYGSGGIARFDGTTWAVYDLSIFGFPPPTSSAIAVDTRDVIWVGTNEGIARLDGTKWTLYNTSNSDLPHNSVSSITIDESGARYFGTFDGVGVMRSGTDYLITDHAQWLAPARYRATYDITSLVPRGTYSITVDSAIGLDGIAITPNSAYTFTVDYAGGVVDTTPPPVPSLSVDICRNSTTSVAASWSASDPNSAITLYRYALGSSTNSIDVINWTDTGSTSVTRTGLNLVAGQRYYFSIKARNAGGLWSEATSRSFTAGVPCQKVYLPLVRK